MTYIFLIHVLATSVMLGIIWIIQLVHYPSFRFVDTSNYRSFQNFHIKRISIIVVPVMIIEALSGLIYLIYFIKNIEVFFLVSMMLLIVIWLVTGFIFSGLHQNLLIGYNRLTINKLVSLNWIRTLLWSLRFILLIISIIIKFGYTFIIH